MVFHVYVQENFEVAKVNSAISKIDPVEHLAMRINSTVPKMVLVQKPIVVCMVDCISELSVVTAIFRVVTH